MGADAVNFESPPTVGRGSRLGRGAVLFCVGSLLMCAVWGCGRLDASGRLVRELEAHQPSELSLRAKRCSEPGPLFDTYVEATRWLEGDVFYALVAAAANCGDDYWVGDYQVEDDRNLVLEYTTIRAGGEDACVCRVELEYRINGLNRRDYSVTVHHAGTVVP
jgi:hypothetical protein